MVEGSTGTAVIVLQPSQVIQLLLGVILGARRLSGNQERTVLCRGGADQAAWNLQQLELDVTGILDS